MAKFDDKMTQETRVKALLFYALNGDDTILYDPDIGFFEEVMNVMDRMDDSTYMLLKALQEGKCCKTLYNIILSYQDRMLQLCDIMDNAIGVEDFINNYNKGEE